MANAFYLSSSIFMNDLSKDSSKKNDVIDKEPPPYQSSLNSTSISNKVKYQSEEEAGNNTENTQPFVDSRLTLTPRLDYIDTYEKWSIFNILCCCIFIGIIAGYFSHKTKVLKATGNFRGAINASRNAQIINIVATLVGIIIIFSLFFLPHLSSELH